MCPISFFKSTLLGVQPVFNLKATVFCLKYYSTNQVVCYNYKLHLI